MVNTASNSLLSFPLLKQSFIHNLEYKRLLPTEEDVKFFREHGWFVSQKVLSESLIDRIFFGY